MYKVVGSMSVYALLKSLHMQFLTSLLCYLPMWFGFNLSWFDDTRFLIVVVVVGLMKTLNRDVNQNNRDSVSGSMLLIFYCISILWYVQTEHEAHT